MSDAEEKPGPESDSELEREIRKGRKLTMAEALGRLAGPGAMKGESPVTRFQQAETEIASWLEKHLVDAGGALQVVLHRQIKESELLLNNFDEPLVVLADFCKQVLNSDFLLEELVRNADTEWAQVMGERPYFDKVGTPSHPDDPYQLESVRNKLSALLEQLSGG